MLTLRNCLDRNASNQTRSTIIITSIACFTKFESSTPCITIVHFKLLVSVLDVATIKTAAKKYLRFVWQNIKNTQAEGMKIYLNNNPGFQLFFNQVSVEYLGEFRKFLCPFLGGFADSREIR